MLNISSDYNGFGFNSFKFYELGIKFDFNVQKVKVNLGPSFEQTLNALYPRSYIPYPKDVDLLFRRFFKGFLPFMGVDVTRNIWTNFRSPILSSLHMNFESNGPSGF